MLEMIVATMISRLSARRKRKAHAVRKGKRAQLAQSIKLIVFCLTITGASKAGMSWIAQMQ
jgi:hypothetical protein